MRIALVRPPFVGFKFGPPIGLAYLSQVLKQQGHKVKVLDINMFIKRASLNPLTFLWSCLHSPKLRTLANLKAAHHGEYRKLDRMMWYNRDFRITGNPQVLEYADALLDYYCGKVLTFRPDLVGLSLSYSTVDFGLRMAEILSKQVRCIAGGPEASFNENRILSLGYFDAVVSGYGEEAILEALERPGIIRKNLFREKEYEPDYADLPLSEYNGRLPIVTTRGCPNNCSFCTQNHPYFFHSIESVVRQIRNARDLREIMYNDSNINVNSDRTEELFSEIAAAKPNVPAEIFGMQVRPNFESYISKMADSGVKIARVGIESGSLRERESMNKPPFDNDLVVEMIKELSRHRIETLAQYIFCYPDETVDDREQTLELINRINSECEKMFIRHQWYKFVVHTGREDFFREQYGVITESPSNWRNDLYNSKKIELLASEYRQKVPENVLIML